MASSFPRERIDWIFNKDIQEKKRLAGQAKYRKRGSKSKKCTLGSDGLTKKQWRERCGKVMSYDLHKPLRWKEFSEMPPDIQKEYLEGLIREFQTPASSLAKMFGVTAQTVVKRCNTPEIGIKFSPGKRLSGDRLQAFSAFCSEGDAEEPSSEDELAQEMRNSEAMRQYLEQPVQVFHEINDMAMTDFTLCFHGAYRADMIRNSMLSMLPERTQVKIEIHCEIQK